MNDEKNTEQQQPTTPTGEEKAGEKGRMFTQDEVNRIVSDRLARERERLADSSEYKDKYEAVKKELEGIKAAQARQQKETAYRELLAKANISEKRIATVIKASAAEIDALELDESGAAVGADKLVEAIKTEWADFVVHTVIKGADVPHPPVNCGGSGDPIANAFKPKI